MSFAVTNSLSSDAETGISCFILKAGQPDWQVRFYPSLYQLRVRKGDSEEQLDLGYAGSRLLERLLAKPGDLVAREELLAHAWSGRVVGQGSLNQQIYSLRQMLADESLHQIIQTVPRRGYMFNPAYFGGTAREDNSVAAEPAAAVVTATESKTPRSPVLATLARYRRWALPALAAIGTVALGALTLGYAYLQHSDARLASTEIGDGQVYILYVNKGKKSFKELVDGGEEKPTVAVE